MSLIHRIGAFLHSPSGQHRSRRATEAEPAAPQQPGGGRRATRAPSLTVSAPAVKLASRSPSRRPWGAHSD